MRTLLRRNLLLWAVFILHEEGQKHQDQTCQQDKEDEASPCNGPAAPFMAALLSGPSLFADLLTTAQLTAALTDDMCGALLCTDCETNKTKIATGLEEL